jgi:hypothetical protein
MALREEVLTMPLPVRVPLSDLVAQAKQLGAAAHPEIAVWGGDVGAEIIEDAYSRSCGRACRVKPQASTGAKSGV